MKTASLSASLSLVLLCVGALACGAPPSTHEARVQRAINADDAEGGTASDNVPAAPARRASDVESEFLAFSALVDEPQECIALTFCADGCVDVKDDVDNCGACGMRCLLGDYCQDGRCHCTSDEGPD